MLPNLSAGCRRDLPLVHQRKPCRQFKKLRIGFHGAYVRHRKSLFAEARIGQFRKQINSELLGIPVFPLDCYALDALDDALKFFGENKLLRRARSRAEKRRHPVLRFLSRENFLNRELGKLRHRAFKRLGKDNF